MFFVYNNGAGGSPFKLLSIIFLLISLYGFISNAIQNINTYRHSNASSNTRTSTSADNGGSANHRLDINHPDHPFWTEYTSNYQLGPQRDLHKINHFDYGTFLDLNDNTNTYISFPITDKKRKLYKDKLPAIEKTKSKFVVDLGEKSIIELLHIKNESMIQSYRIKREWSKNSHRLRNHFNGNCLSKVNRIKNLDNEHRSYYDRDKSVQEIKMLCCEESQFYKKTQKNEICREFIFPLFFGLDLIEDITLLEQYLNNPNYLNHLKHLNHFSKCLYLVIRNDKFAYRTYCFNDQEYKTREFDANTPDEIISKSEYFIYNSNQEIKNSAIRSIPKTDQKTIPLLNPIGIVAYLNQSKVCVLSISQDVKNDPLRTSEYDDTSIGDIDLTTYCDNHIEHRGRVGIPSYLTYFLSGTTRDEVFQSTKLLTCSSSNCIFSFLFGLYVNIDYRRNQLEKNTNNNSGNISISVVDYRDYTFDFNLDSLFKNRIIFRNRWLPPEIKISNDGNHVALHDMYRNRILLFKRDAEGLYQIYSEYYEKSEKDFMSLEKVTIDLIVDFSFIEANNSKFSETILQILYYGKRGYHSHFYPLKYNSQSYMNSFYYEFISAVKEKWDFIFIVLLLTILFIANEIRIRRRIQEGNISQNNQPNNHND